jgi:hypothetical protein
MFKDLAHEYPNVKFEPFLAHEDGSMTRFWLDITIDSCILII